MIVYEEGNEFQCWALRHELPLRERLFLMRRNIAYLGSIPMTKQPLCGHLVVLQPMKVDSCSYE